MYKNRPNVIHVKLFYAQLKRAQKYHATIVKMSTIVGIVTFISMINTTFENNKNARKVFNFQNCKFKEQLEFHTQMS